MNTTCWMDFVTNVSNLCIKHYNDALPKKGKPQVNREWTLLAAVVQNSAASMTATDGLKVVAMATGSKCIGQNKMSKEGNIINDSHAEVLARRAFIRYLNEQLHFAYSDQRESIFTGPDQNFKCHLKDDVEFYFFTSHTPCGDASIFPKEDPPLIVSSHDESKNETLRKEANVTIKEKDTDFEGTDCERDFSPGIKHNQDHRKEEISLTVSSHDESKNKTLRKEANVTFEDRDAQLGGTDGDIDFSPGIKRDQDYRKEETPLTVSSSQDESKIKTLRNEADVTFEEKGSDLGGTDCETEISRGIKRAKKGLGKGSEDISSVLPAPSEDFCSSKRIKMEVLTSTTHTEIKGCDRRVPKEWSGETNNEELASNPAKSPKAHTEVAVTSNDIYRTGAKCVPGGPQDLLHHGAEYHRVGLLRLKPGRGDRTLSMSCSDKMARWNVVGYQGALLSHFLDKPVHMKTLIVGKCPYNQAAMERALIGRLQPVSDLPEPYRINVPSIVSSQIAFPDAKDEVQAQFAGNQGKMAPAGSAIIWSRVQCKPLEVSVIGSRQGVTTKNLHKVEARCSVCKAEMFRSFKELMQAIPEHQLPLTLRSSKLQNYLDFKQAATVYQEALGRLLHVFDTWVKKPEEYSLFS
ncbi:tRNA-specific adenosine deaminase 1-like isoform X2 [Asterias rubens]|uniref:tRNA-specific adenosine deaminase 1-like isoform X2 n=1 Tax=Asterias rubens TaxID=7604 RepID=UPI0014553719|nr:tRNA-specific adenosine deaminase 1-like isoform X2 [Asterias rubens]